jgi:hypothetical protein
MLLQVAEVVAGVAAEEGAEALGGRCQKLESQMSTDSCRYIPATAYYIHKNTFAFYNCLPLVP